MIYKMLLTLSVFLFQEAQAVSMILKGDLSPSSKEAEARLERGTLVGAVDVRPLTEGKKLYQIGWYALKTKEGTKYLKTPRLSRLLTKKKQIEGGQVISLPWTEQALLKGLLDDLPNEVNFKEIFSTERRLPELLNKKRKKPKSAKEKLQNGLRVKKSGEEGANPDGMIGGRGGGSLDWATAGNDWFGGGKGKDSAEKDPAEKEAAIEEKDPAEKEGAIEEEDLNVPGKEKLLTKNVICKINSPPFFVTITRHLQKVGFIEGRSEWWHKTRIFHYDRYDPWRVHKGYKKRGRKWHALLDGQDTYPFKKHFERSCRIGIEGKIASKEVLSDWAVSKAYRKTTDSGPGHDVWRESGELGPFLQSGKVRCQIVNRQPLKTNERKTIGGVRYLRKMWVEKVTYKCTFARIDTCKALKSIGTEKGKKCIEEIGGRCAVWQMNYEIKEKKQDAS